MSQSVKRARLKHGKLFMTNEQEREYRKNHIERLNRGECDPEKGVNFITLLSNLERIGDHSNNVAGYTLEILSLDKDKKLKRSA